MNTLDILWYAWPWVGFGAAVVLIILLLTTNKLNGDSSDRKLHSPVWLSWAIAAAYLLHVLEEYGLYVQDGQYLLITMFSEMGISEKFGDIPLIAFPYYNIMLTWVGLPLAAVLSKKNPVVGLSGAGFLIINGLMHIGAPLLSSVAGIDMGAAAYGGAITGVVIFLPLAVWIIYVCKKDGLLPKGGLKTAIVSGVIGHMALFTMYILNKLIGGVFMYFYIPVVGVITIPVAILLGKVFMKGVPNSK